MHDPKDCLKVSRYSDFPLVPLGRWLGQPVFLHLFEPVRGLLIFRGPIVTGTSVLAIKFGAGVMVAADCLASYGSLARFRDVQRIQAIGESTVLGCSGDIADFQHVLHLMDEIQ